MAQMKMPLLNEQVFSDQAYGPIIARFQQSAPVDVVKMAEALGVRVWELSDLEPHISGKLFKDPTNGGPSGYSIGVNAKEAFVRKRFTVAHELAHFILHRNRIKTELVDDTMYRSGLVSSAEEVEANKMAAFILMPLKLVKQLMDNGIKDVDMLAKILQVSGSAMRIRLGVPVV
jgi:Zn-dependent peptidase ImmA (M78 family)